jgi:hypothetical protein
MHSVVRRRRPGLAEKLFSMLTKNRLKMYARHNFVKKTFWKAAREHKNDVDWLFIHSDLYR